MNLELSLLASWAPDIFFLLLYCWDSRLIMPIPALYVGAGNLNSGSQGSNSKSPDNLAASRAPNHSLCKKKAKECMK